MQASARHVISEITAKMPPSPIERGYIISGKYQLVQLLGRGSMGEVWVAHHQTLGEDVAIKLLAPAYTSSEVESYPTASARFRFEAQVAARLSRKTRHIVRVTDHGEEEGDTPAYLVMELLLGHTLEMCLAIYGDMPPDEVLRLVAQIARALEYAHVESVVHRDLKPANIFLARDEDGGVLVKVLDFGIARATRTQRMPSPFSTGEGIVFGTPGYMSPEQVNGSRLDVRVDLWALATVAYEALTGELPLRGTHAHELLRSLHLGEIVPIHERDPELPAGLAEFFRRAFDPRIENRFASASELASSFAQAVATPGAARERTAPMPASRRLQGDTLPMAVESPQAPKVSRPVRRAWPRLAFGASVVALVTIVATRMNRTPSVGGAAPVSSSAVARTSASAFALVPESRSPADPAPSGTPVAPLLPESSPNLHASRPTRGVTGPASPNAPASPASAKTSEPRAPSLVAPVPPPSVAPASPASVDKSATL
jgi:eukaryotic-like serine/threonine-protein kinase